MLIPSLPDDLALQAAIGRVAIRHGQLNLALQMTVKSFHKLSIREALRRTRRKGPAWLHKLILKDARARLGEGEALDGLIRLLERSQRATDRRNDLLHGLWAQELGGDHFILDDDHTRRPIPSVSELNDLTKELTDLAYDLHDARLNGFLKYALESSH
jgi:hypothetical protein